VPVAQRSTDLKLRTPSGDAEARLRGRPKNPPTIQLANRIPCLDLAEGTSIPISAIPVAGARRLWALVQGNGTAADLPLKEVNQDGYKRTRAL